MALGVLSQTLVVAQRVAGGVFLGLRGSDVRAVAHLGCRDDVGNAAVEAIDFCLFVLEKRARVSSGSANRLLANVHATGKVAGGDHELVADYVASDAAVPGRVRLRVLQRDCESKRRTDDDRNRVPATLEFGVFADFAEHGAIGKTEVFDYLLICVSLFEREIERVDR